MKTRALTKWLSIALGAVCYLMGEWNCTVLAGQNDVPAGAAQVDVSPQGKPIWWVGTLYKDGDVDWYWFEVKNPLKLYAAFEKPADRSFFCSLYSEQNTANPLLDVLASNRGEEFAGYSSRDLAPGKYYLKIWGGPGEFSALETDSYYYALSEPPPDATKDMKDKLSKTPAPQPQPDEMNKDEAERMLDALKSEEEEQRQEKIQEKPSDLPEVLKDW
jgi:hypothetical protein